MELRKSTFVEIIRTVLGFAFVLSGLTKAFDVNHFSAILSSYGIDQLYLLSPVIIFAELLLGLSLIFDLRTKIAAGASTLMLLVFTIGYTYGNLVFDIKDCGCYGNIEFLKTSPLMVYIRNILLIGCSVWVYFQTSNSNKPISDFVYYATILIVFVVAFGCGYTFPHNIFKGSDKADSFDSIALSDHPLNKFITTSADSTYLVTVFSYTCPHCLNSMGNIEQYQNFNVVDKVIGIGLDSGDEQEGFRNILRPSFQILNYPEEQIIDLTLEFPTAFFIKNDSIIKIIQGEMPSAYFYMSAQPESPKE